MPERKDLHQFARSRGFPTEREMLWQWYVNKGWSIRAISKATGIAYDSIYRRLEQLRIPIRKNKKGKNDSTTYYR